MYCGSPNSVMQDENCAESATTLAPQTAATISNAIGLAPNKKPMIKQQLPLISMAHDVMSVRPSLSARRPAATQPIAPQPITTNDAVSARAGLLPLFARLARI